MTRVRSAAKDASPNPMAMMNRSEVSRERRRRRPGVATTLDQAIILVSQWNTATNDPYNVQEFVVNLNR